MATGKAPPSGGGDPAGEDAWAERAAWCSKYLALLSTFAARTTAAAAATSRPSGGGIITLLSDLIDGGDVVKRLRFEWSSAAGGLPTTFWPLSGAPADAVMVAALLASALRAGAAAAAARLASEPEARAESGGAAFTAAAALARGAAGAWEAVQDAATAADAPGPTTRSSAEDAGPLPRGLALPGDRPAELVPATAGALSRLCLADAQALAAARAEAKGLSPGALAALHAGAAGLYEEAGSALAAASVDACVPLAAGLGAGAAVGAALSEARARLATARDAFETGLDPGRAIAELRAASACLARGRAVVKNGSGLGAADATAAATALSGLEKTVAAAAAGLDRERLVVYMTPIPSSPGPLPVGKVVVAATPLVVEPVSAAHF